MSSKKSELPGFQPDQQPRIEATLGEEKKISLEIQEAPESSGRKQSLEGLYGELRLKNIGLIRLEQELLDTLMRNPNSSYDDLVSVITRYADEYHFPQEVVDSADSVLQTVLEKHELVRSVREQYPDDNNLFEALLGKEPKGKIEVVERPFAFLSAVTTWKIISRFIAVLINTVKILEIEWQEQTL